MARALRRGAHDRNRRSLRRFHRGRERRSQRTRLGILDLHGGLLEPPFLAGRRTALAKDLPGWHSFRYPGLPALHTMPLEYLETFVAKFELEQWIDRTLGNRQLAERDLGCGWCNRIGHRSSKEDGSGRRVSPGLRRPHRGHQRRFTGRQPLTGDSFHRVRLCDPKRATAPRPRTSRSRSRRASRQARPRRTLPSPEGSLRECTRSRRRLLLPAAAMFAGQTRPTRPCLMSAADPTTFTRSRPATSLRLVRERAGQQPSKQTERGNPKGEHPEGHARVPPARLSLTASRFDSPTCIHALSDEKQAHATSQIRLPHVEVEICAGSRHDRGR